MKGEAHGKRDGKFAFLPFPLKKNKHTHIYTKIDCYTAIFSLDCNNENFILKKNETLYLMPLIKVAIQN